MGRRSLVSFSLLILPIAITTGVLVGLDAFRSSRGQTRLFVSNAVKTATYCQRAFGITPVTQGQQFTLNPNQWGWTEGESGGLCMNVTTHSNGTYATNTTAPVWSITWQYPRGPETQPVHAFPNCKIDSEVQFPIEISKVQKIPIEAKWNYGSGTTIPRSTNANALEAAGMNANVAIDMFIDPDSNKAEITTQAKYEVMIWLGAFGAATQPLGLKLGPRKTQRIGDVEFKLYLDVNGVGQTVLTWVADSFVTDFRADVGPLLQGLTGIGGPTIDDYLGYLAFGSEAYSSGDNVTLSVSHLRMNIDTS